jgi:hypothetical protein
MHVSMRAGGKQLRAMAQLQVLTEKTTSPRLSRQCGVPSRSGLAATQRFGRGLDSSSAAADSPI